MCTFRAPPSSTISILLGPGLLIGGSLEKHFDVGPRHFLFYLTLNLVYVGAKHFLFYFIALNLVSGKSELLGLV